ncbi:MAG: hypothetical protein PVI43_06765 [Candidatus Bathyarchaeota archaeon]|jgi:uncharacterized coiled-coil DUF342 family protein
MSDSPEQKIKALNQELTPLKEERNRLNDEAKKWAQKRDALHEKTRNMRKDANSIKEKRDALNEKVQELKNLRSQVTARRKEKLDKFSELREKIRALNEKLPNGNLRQVQREIEDIDWKIQTNSLPVKEEQELVNRVRYLESLLVDQKQIKKIKDELFKLRAEEQKFGSEAKTIHDKLSELAEQSQKYHAQMIDILEKSRELQAEANEGHKKFVEAKEEAQKVHQKFVEVLEKIRSIERDLKETADKKQAERQNELKGELEKRALEKMKRGEKLMWEEFQVLAEKGLI